jgi:ribosomal biogenesis protein LAS1
MAWLLHYYFLPTLNPSTASISQTTLRPLAPILQEYKSILKLTTRDISLKSQYKDTISSIFKGIERWISEARVAANVLSGELGWEAGTEVRSEYIEGKEKWALERVCDALIEKGALVPLSKKCVLYSVPMTRVDLSRKRDFPSDQFHPPLFSVQLWAPLLQHIQSLHPGFFCVLANHTVFVLLTDREALVEDPTRLQPDQTYEMCLARWALWSIEAWERENQDPGRNLRKEITSGLIQSLGHPPANSSRDRKAYV